MHRQLAAALALTLTATLTAGCGSDTATPSADEPDKVTYLTSFQRFGRDAYVDLAIERGYFAAENIQVDVQPGQATENAKLIATGTADFAAGDFTGTLLQMDRNRDIDLVAVALIQRRSLSAIMTLADGPVTTPSDLTGRTIADLPSSVVRLLFPAYAQLSGFDPSTVRWVNAQGPQLAAMLTTGPNPVDAIGQFVVGRPLVQTASGGRQIRTLPYSDVMSDLLGNALWTSRTLAEDNPDLVRRFRRALLRGLADTVTEAGTADRAGAAAAGRALNKHVPVQNPTVAAAELELMALHVGPPPLGVIDPTAAAKNIAILQGAGVITPGWTPDRLIAADLASEGVRRK